MSEQKNTIENLMRELDLNELDHAVGGIDPEKLTEKDMWYIRIMAILYKTGKETKGWDRQYVIDTSNEKDMEQNLFIWDNYVE